MIVIYLKENNQFIMKVGGFPEVEERDNKLYFKDGKVIINDLTKASYKEYPDQDIEIPMEEDGETGIIGEIPQTLEQLNLRDFTAEELEERQKPKLIDRVKALEDRVHTLEIKPIGRK